MELQKVSADEYAALFTSYPHVFNSAAFNMLNAGKAERLHWLLFAEGGRRRAGLVAGERDGRLRSPFSAPFGGLTPCGSLRVGEVSAIASLLREYGEQESLVPEITLPPLIYGSQLITAQAMAFKEKGRVESCDINYHFPTARMADYRAHMADTARKHLNRSLRAGLSFEVLPDCSRENVERAYRVIEANRREHGYPLRMTLEQVLGTVEVVKADFFVATYGGEDIAAAQVFHVARGIVQVIYWGHISEYNRLYPMNFLSYHLFTHYASQGIEVVDIGPSSTDSIPNPGLCDFKESIGCVASPKLSLSLSTAK